MSKNLTTKSKETGSIQRGPVVPVSEFTQHLATTFLEEAKVKDVVRRQAYGTGKKRRVLGMNASRDTETVTVHIGKKQRYDFDPADSSHALIYNDTVKGYVIKASVNNTPFASAQGMFKVAVDSVFKHLKIKNIVIIGDGERGSTFARVVERLPAMIHNAQEEQLEKRVEQMVQLLLPEDAFAEIYAQIEDQNVKARERFIKDHQCLTSKTVANNAGSTAENFSAVTSRWKAAGRIFSIRAGSQDVFPAFQFKDGQPHPTIEKVLTLYKDKRSDWQTAFWFTTVNSWLGDRVPIEMLDDEQAILEAAHAEIEAYIG